MGNINPFRYYKNNKKKLGILMTIIGLAVFCIVTIMTIVSSIYDTCWAANVEIFNKITLVNESSDELQGWIEENREVVHGYDVDVMTTDISTVFGTTSSYVFALDDLEELVEELEIEITDGEIPAKNQSEILVNEYIARNKKLDIGDHIGEFTISGIYSGDLLCSLCYKEDFETLYGASNSVTLLLPKDGKTITSVNNQLKSLDDDIEVVSVDKKQKELDEEFQTMKTIMKLIIVLVSVSLAIAVSAFVYTNYVSRSDEFAIYYAIGYGIRKIVKLIIEETVLVSVISYLVGYIVAAISLQIVNVKVYQPLGQCIQIITLENLIYPVVIPVLVLIFSVVPIVYKLRKTDLLTIIERR